MKLLLFLLVGLCLLTGSECSAFAVDTQTQAAALNAQGKTAYDAGKYADAIPLFQKAIALAPDQVNYVTNLASSERQTQQYAAAQAALLGALETFSKLEDQNTLQIALADTHFFWARSLVKQDKHSEAIAHYQAAAAIDRTRRPTDAGYDLDNLGDALHHLGRDAEAGDAYKESLAFRRALTGADRNADSEASSLAGIIVTNLALNRYDDAAVAYDDLRVVKPSAATIYEAAMLNALADAHGLGGPSAALKTKAAALNTQGIADYIARRYEKAIPQFQQAMRLMPDNQIYVLNLARAFNSAKRSAEALALVESKLSAFPDPVERKELLIEWADAHFGLGQAQVAHSHWAAALSNYFAAYSVDRVARHRDAALDLRYAGEAEVGQFHFESAQKLFRHSAETAEAAGEPEIEAVSLRLLGQNLNRQQQFMAALEVLQKALSLTRARNLRLEEGRVLASLGTSAGELSRYTEALEFHQQALAAFQELGNQGEAAIVLNNLGGTSYHLMHYAEARSFYLQSLKYSHSVQDAAGEAGALANLGQVSDSQSRYAEAISYFRQAIALCPPKSRLLQKPHALQGIGATYYDMGRPLEAIRITKEALAIFRREGDRSGESTCLNNIGLFYVSRGEYDRAIDFYQQALALRRILGQRREEATDLNNLGELYHTIGQPGKAVDFYDQALTILREIGDPTQEATTLNNQAVVFADTANSDPVSFDKAEALYQQALSLFRQVGNEDWSAALLGNLGALNIPFHPVEAQKYLAQALASHQRTGNLDGQSSVLNNLANLAARQHQAAEAAGYYAQAIVIAAKAQNKDTLTYSWNGLMLLNADTDPSWAIYCGKKAVNLLQSIRGNLKSFDKAIQKKYLDIHSTSYRTLATLLISQGRLDEAQQVLGMLKEEEFFDFLGRDPSAAKTLTTTAALNTFEADWSGRFDKASDRAALLGDMSHAFLEAAPMHKAVTRRQALPAGTVAVYTIVEPEKLYLIVTTKTGQVARQSAIKSEDLYRRVLAFRNALQDPTHDPRPLAQELYNIIIGPLEADLKAAHASTLLWSLDDALRYLPLSALYDGHRYMVERYNNGILTLAAPRRTAAASGATSWTGLGLGVSLSHPGFDALPGVRAELSGIFGPVVPGTALLDAQFTQTAFLADLKRRTHPLVHIASHFALSGRDTDSFLLLGDGGHLTLAQMKADPNVFQGVDLLTLSACNTAMEVRSAGGKEVEGFGALAQRLGARSVLASLWPVADASTPVLMREFYRLRRANPKLSKAAGLRQAQIELLTGKAAASAPPSKTNRAQRAKIAGAANADLPAFKTDPKAPYAHPYYWAPFVLIGNPQ